MSFKSQLSALKKKLKKQEVSVPKTVQVEEPKPTPLEDESIEILEYLDIHGVENKDIKPKNSSKPDNPVMSKHHKATVVVDHTAVDLSDFEEPFYDEAKGVEEILAFVDSHGIETKSADYFEVKQHGEEGVVRSKHSTEKRIDLHGLTVRDAELKISAVFENAKIRGYQQILIIHGRGNHSAGGDPVLKRMVMSLLEGTLESQVSSFYFAPLNEGGGGATRVILK